MSFHVRPPAENNYEDMAKYRDDTVKTDKPKTQLYSLQQALEMLKHDDINLLSCLSVKRLFIEILYYSKISLDDPLVATG